MERFDLIIIGGGPAGAAAAATAHALGAGIALIEGAAVGDFPASGVPTKNLLHAGEVVHLAKQKNLKAVGGSQAIALNFPEALKEAAEVVAAVRRQRYEDKLRGMRWVSRFRGQASFTSPHQIDVDGRRLRGAKFIIATGSVDRVPKIEGLEEAGYLTHADVLGLKAPPASLIVVGAGPLGLELAQMFAHFGTRVRVIQRGRRILPRVEPEIAEAATAFLEEDGIVIHVDESVRSVELRDGSKFVTVKAVGLDQRYRTQEILMAAGRAPNTAGLGLEEIGVQLDRTGAMVVDDELVSSVPHIYAAGDVCGEPMLESVAVKEGAAAAANALGGERLQIDYEAVPGCAFTHPEVAQVGLTEAEAQRRGHETIARVLDFTKVPRAQIMRDTRGLIKLVAERQTGRILGCAAVAANAGDLINEAALAVKQKMSLSDLRDAIFAYPTISEALVLVAEEFTREPRRPRRRGEERKVA